MAPGTTCHPFKRICEAILRVHWSAVTDIGDCSYDLVSALLPLSSAPQLALLEANSPHLLPYTDDIWKDLCVADFIEVRKLVEDGRMKAEDEPASWRERYQEEEKKREAKMQAILSKMRGQYSEYSSGRGTVQTIDGLRQEKRRKTSHTTTARPKTLFDKAKSNARLITSIYAPKRRTAGGSSQILPAASSSQTSRPVPPTARPPTSSTKRGRDPTSSTSTDSHSKKPSITVVRTLKRPIPPSDPASVSSKPSHANRDIVASRVTREPPSRTPSHQPLHPPPPSGRVPPAMSPSAPRPDSKSVAAQRRSGGKALIGALCVAAGVVLYSQLPGQAVQLEGEADKPAFTGGAEKQPQVFLWGRNTHSVAAPSSTSSSSVKKPSPTPALSGLVLRDLALSATYGCAIDSKGDVLQWGHGYGGPDGEVETSVKGLNLVQVAPTEQGKVFGLSKKGEVFVWASDKLRQRAGAVAEDTKQNGTAWSSLFWPWGKGAGAGDVEVLKVAPDVKLQRNERFVSLSSGDDHLLALTSIGRSFAVPLSLKANSHGQLGVRAVSLLAPPHPGSSAVGSLSVRLEPDERLNERARDATPLPPKRVDPLLLPAVPPPTLDNPLPKDTVVPALPVSSPTNASICLDSSPEQHAVLERSPRFCTTLHEISSLKGLEVAELVAGAKHSLVRLGGTMEGRVLGFGANSYGQLGLGPALSFPSIPAPTEIPLSSSPSYALGGASNRPSSIKCDRIAAGGNVSYFVVTATRAGDFKNGAAISQDLLAAGQGQTGSIGNGLWAHAFSPVRVKAVSGLSEWSETSGRLENIKIRDVKAGAGHVAVILDNAVSLPSGVTFGRDVLLFGLNESYQLGTGKRSNLAIPQHLGPLPYPQEKGTFTSEGVASNRLQLAATLPASSASRQLNPGLRRNALIEEAIVAGDGGTGVYWRVIDA
ncbi:hypothetical protein JCM8547_001209 [Rhodosporidiobolus lusitaniae]